MLLRDRKLRRLRGLGRSRGRVDPPKPFQAQSDLRGHSAHLRGATGVGGGRLPLVYLVAYLVPTVAPLFVSTANLARTIGTMLVISLGATVLIQRNALTSVWCFFAAILSSLIILSVERLRHTATTAPGPPSPRPHHPDRLPLSVP